MTAAAQQSGLASVSSAGGTGTLLRELQPSDSEYAYRVAASLRPGGLEQNALVTDGFVVLRGMLSHGDRCRLLQMFEEDQRVRALADRKLYKARNGWGQELRPRVVNMERLNFGQGEYTYLKEPLPAPLGELREALYSALAPVANSDLQRHRRDVAPKPFAVDAFPPQLEQFWELCRTADPPQCIPSCLVLQYNKGGHNLPHRDIYGCISFPYQALTILTVPGEDFDGGQFYVQPRKNADNRRRHIPLSPGDVLVFQATRWHGSEPVTWGRRVACGIQFHLSQT